MEVRLTLQRLTMCLPIAAALVRERRRDMRLNLAFRPLVECLILLAPVPLHAGLPRIFNLDRYSWDATHIVLVETTSDDAIFSVLESWKGDLKPGQSIDVPELKPNGNVVPIWNYETAQGLDESKLSGQIPKQPIGSQMILFLKKEKDDVGSSVKWAAVSFNGMKESALWIHGGRAFCFQDWKIPAVGVLSPCIQWPARSSDVAVFTIRIQEVLQAQRDLADTLELKDSGWRAEKLGIVALGDLYPAQKEAIDALGKAGTIALPEILQVMDKPPGIYDGDELIHVFVEAAGKDSGKQLHARLQQDVIYWKTVGPTLTRDWLDQLFVVPSPLFVKFKETTLLIRELDRERYSPASQTITELREFWVSQPQLYDPKWGDDRSEINGSVAAHDGRHLEVFGLIQECDSFLKMAGNKN